MVTEHTLFGMSFALLFLDRAQTSGQQDEAQREEVD